MKGRNLERRVEQLEDFNRPLSELPALKLAVADVRDGSILRILKIPLVEPGRRRQFKARR